MTPIDPVCAFHGKHLSEHECLYCTLCFKDLKREECSYLPDGTQVNVCIPCAEAEQRMLVKIALERPRGLPEPTRLTDEEIWGLDTSLAGLIADAVRRLRDMDHGHPGGLTTEEWQTILTEIADGFEAYYEADAEADRPDAALDLLKEWWQALWD